MLGEARNAVEVRDRAKCHDEVIVFELVTMEPTGRRDGHGLRVDVDVLDGANEQPRALQQPAKWAHDRCEIEVACRHLVHHGGEQKKFLPIHKRDPNSGVSWEESLELARGRQAAESPAEDDHACDTLIPHSHATTAMP